MGDKSVIAHLFCHPEGNIFCHAGTGSVKGQALCFVRMPTFFVGAADAPGKTKAINPSCASARDHKRKRYLPGYMNRKDTVFAFMKKNDIIEITIPIERNTIAVLIVMTRTHDTAIVPNMIIVSHFLEYVKGGIHYITGTETVLCPDCGQIMNPHCRCRRYIRRLNGMRDKLSVRVLFCALCHRYHRELPDFVTPFKHLCTEAIAAIHDAIGDYCVDDHSAARIRRWVERLLKFGSATVRRLKLEYPMLVTNYDVNSTFDTLRYFVRAVANADEWKANEFV